MVNPPLREQPPILANYWLRLRHRDEVDTDQMRVALPNKRLDQAYAPSLDFNQPLRNATDLNVFELWDELAATANYNVLAAKHIGSFHYVRGSRLSDAMLHSTALLGAVHRRMYRISQLLTRL